MRAGIERCLLLFLLISLTSQAEPSRGEKGTSPSVDLPTMVMTSLKDPTSHESSPPSAPPPAAISSPSLTPSEAVDKARFRFLDKTFAKVFARTLNINSRYRWGPLEIQVLRCHKSAPQEGGDSLVFIEIYDTAPSLMPTLIFKGWMSALYPGVSGLDHPLYDVWLEKCE